MPLKLSIREKSDANHEQSVNTFTLYPSKCAHTGVAMLSMYHPKHSPIKALSHDAYWSDDWDPYDYGVDFDWSRTFFEQLNE